jgi:hypothetical protein
MKGINGEQMSVHPKFKRVCHNLLDDWNANNKEQTRNEGKKLTIQRLSLTLARLFEQRTDLYTLIINAKIDLNEV